MALRGIGVEQCAQLAAREAETLSGGSEGDGVAIHQQGGGGERSIAVGGYKMGGELGGTLQLLRLVLVAIDPERVMGDHGKGLAEAAVSYLGLVGMEVTRYLPGAWKLMDDRGVG